VGQKLDSVKSPSKRVDLVGENRVEFDAECNGAEDVDGRPEEEVLRRERGGGEERRRRTRRREKEKRREEGGNIS